MNDDDKRLLNIIRKYEQFKDVGANEQQIEQGMELYFSGKDPSVLLHDIAMEKFRKGWEQHEIAQRRMDIADIVRKTSIMGMTGTLKTVDKSKISYGFTYKFHKDYAEEIKDGKTLCKIDWLGRIEEIENKN